MKNHELLLKLNNYRKKHMYKSINIIMSNMTTLQDTEYESEQIIIKKSILDNHMAILHERLNNMNAELIQKEKEKKEYEEKFNITFQELQELKAKHDVFKQQLHMTVQALQKMEAERDI